MSGITTRLNDEADLCRNDGADDIARLLGEAAAEIARLRSIATCGCGDQFTAHDPGTCGACVAGANAGDEVARLRAAQVWTCFHCGEVCTDAEAARLHFGSSEHQQPGCQIDLAEYRRMEELNRRHCEEDTDLHRALHRMGCEHQEALRREEEVGYAKGLRDGRAESAELTPQQPAPSA